MDGEDHEVGRMIAALLGAAAGLTAVGLLRARGPGACVRPRWDPPARTARRRWLATSAVPAPIRARRARRGREAAVRRALPELVDLLRLATTAGCALPIAHGQVAPHVAEPLRAALLQADDAAGRGRPRADALIDALAPFGERAASVGHLLGDHLRYGVPLLSGLERLSLELRLDRRLAAEVAARRVPVRLLGPLVTCVLPAFALLTVVPLLAASLESLPL
jgi:Flp pilus assembly protein TadB